MKKTPWKKIGVIGVDAGLCWIGDPCYVLHREECAPGGPTPSIGRNWREFCDLLHDTPGQSTQFNYDLGHAGLGVCVSTGWGDGVYDVEARYGEEGRIAEVRVRFM